MLAIYTRLSNEDEQSNSIANQLREGKEFAKNNSYNDFTVYDEGEGVSGGNDIKDRPQLFKLLQDIRSGKISAVWFRNQNRLERNTTTYVIFTDEAKKNGVKLFFGSKEFDLDDPQNRLFGNITSAINQYQKDLQSAQTKKSLLDNAREGKIWSTIPYGYKSNDGYIAIAEDEAEVVKTIYKLSLSGVGTDSIAKRLNEQGIPTRKNKLWRGKTVQGIIKNSLYKGERIYKDEVLESPIIIDSEHWQNVNNNLQKNRNNSGKKIEYKYLLKGLIKCGTCGRNYYGYKRQSLKDNRYLCSSTRYKDLKCGSRSIHIDTLDDIILSIIFEKGELLKHIEKELKRLSKDDASQELKSKIDAKEKQLKSLSKQISNSLILSAKLDDLDDDIINEFKSKIKSLQEKKKRLKGDLEVLKSEYSIYQNLDNTIEKEYKRFDVGDISNLPFDEKQSIIKSVIKGIIILDLKESKHYGIGVSFKSKLNIRHINVILDYSKKIANIFSFDNDNVNFEVYELTDLKDDFYEKKYTDIVFTNVINEYLNAIDKSIEMLKNK